jgi:hypothetical protein
LEGQAVPGPYCALALKAAEELEKMQKDQILDKAKQGVLDASDALTVLNTKFIGYDNCIMTGDPGACSQKNP